MRRRLFALCLLATPLFGQWSRREPVDPAAIIVEFRDPPLSERRAVSAKAAKAEYEAAFRRFRADSKLSPNITYEYYELFNGVALHASPSDIEAIRQLPYVKAIHSDFPVHAFATTAPANVVKIRADQVWSTFGTRGRGVTVAVIDTGIDYNHPALGGGFGPGHKVIGGYNFVGRKSDPMDDNLHGTHVAGIIAGDSDRLLGVAPDVSLIAYKVLDSHGSGKTSDVLAAIERAADPNSDGDFSDHVDVANLSLGGLGNPDDPQSAAIDRGTAVGVVYCVAAGNSGSAFHTVASPGNAKSAITVGATDVNDAVAIFSSRGPNTKNAAMKPDVLAPGVSIVSSLPGGKYGSLSGTSMATPHITGVAALVKAVHPDWSAEQIRSAIVDTASVLNQDLMIQGGGRVDALSAASATTSVSPSSISLGEDHLPNAIWSPFATFQLTNNGSQTTEYTLGTLSTAAVNTVISPATVRLNPGESATISINYNVTNSSITPPSSLAFGGWIAITNSISNEVIRVPWSAVKAARVVFTYDKSLPFAQFVDRSAGTVIHALPLDGTTQEAFLRGGAFDLVASYEQFDFAAYQTSGVIRDSDVLVHYLGGQQIADDTSIHVSSTSATHKVTFNAFNEAGQPLVGENYDGYASTGRIVLPSDSKVKSILLPTFPARTWHISDIAQRLLLQEMNYSFTNGNFYIVQHTPLDGVSEDVTLTAGGSDLKRVSISAALAPASFDQRVVVYAVPIVPANDAFGVLGLVLRTAAPFFNMTLFLSPDVDPNYSMASEIQSITDNSTRFTTPPLRILNGNIVATTTQANLAPWSYSGDGLIFGNGLHFPMERVVPAVPGKPTLFFDFIGQLGETRLGERASTIITLYGSDSTQLATSSIVPVTLDVSQSGDYTVTAVNKGTLSTGIPQTSTVTSTLNSSRLDFSPPTFTTLMLLDGKGQIATHLQSHGIGSLIFGAADFAYTSPNKATYQAIASDQTKAWYRHAGSQQWQPLSISQIGEDETSGIVYRADLTNAANADDVLIDLKLDIADGSGNTTSYVIAPAFAVGRDSFNGRSGPRR